MPRYDFKCPQCGVTFEAITPCDVHVMPCVSCSPVQLGVNDATYLTNLAQRQLCKPAGIYIH